MTLTAVGAKKTPIALLFAAFLVPLLWMMFLNQNLPFSTMDDPTLLYMAKTTPLSKILSRTANPLTPTWSYQLEMQGGGEQNQLGLRPLELLTWKLLLYLFGYAPGAYFLTKAVYLALVSAMIFYFTHRLTGNKTASGLAALFYSTTLPVYMSVFYISDFGLLAQFIQCLATLLFLDIVRENEAGNPALSKTLLRCAALFLITWVGIKAHETMKILPFLFIAFLFWTRRAGLLWLTGTVFGMLILVIPVTSSFKAIDRTAEVKNMLLPNYHWDTLYRSLLQNTKNAWESEPDIAFFSLKSCLPFSIARTLGLFLCWALVIAAILLVLRRRRILGSLDEKKRPLWDFVGLWLLADIAALGVAREADPRHLMIPLVPLAIFFGAGLVFAARTLTGKAKKAFLALCLAGWAFSFLMNLNHQMYFRKSMGGFQIAQQNYLEFIYEDHHGRKARNYEDLTEFMLVPQQLNVWHIPFIVDDNYTAYFKEWTEYDYLLELHKKHGHAYVVTADPSQVADKRYLEKIGEFGEKNRSFFTDFVLRFKKKKGRLFGVYRFNPAVSPRSR